MTPRTAGCAVVIGCGLAALVSLAAAPDHRLIVAETSDITVGTTGPTSLTVSPASGHHISRDAPLIVELGVEGGTDAIRLPRTRYEWKNAADPRATAPRFDLMIEGRAVGDAVVTLAIRFWVCAKKTCRPVRAKRTVGVSVTPPLPDAGPVDDAGPADAG